MPRQGLCAFHSVSSLRSSHEWGSRLRFRIVASALTSGVVFGFDPRFAMNRAQGCVSLIPLTLAQAGVSGGFGSSFSDFLLHPSTGSG